MRCVSYSCRYSHHKTVIGNHDFLFFIFKIVKIVVGAHNFKFKPKTNFLSSNFKSCECSFF